MPEVGVSLTENQKSKNGGKDFSSFFGKPSKYDYLSLTKENMKKSQNLMNSSGYVPSLTDPNENSSNRNNKVVNTNQATNLSLPMINERNMKSSFQNSLNNSISGTVESLRVSTKLSGTLKHALDVLDLIPEYNENEVSGHNVDIFKRRKLYLEEKKESENKLISSSLDEINKFNYSILRNKGWGQYGMDRQKIEEPKSHFKPNKKDLEKELGKRVVNTKLPRSRIIAALMNKVQQ